MTPRDVALAILLSTCIMFLLAPYAPRWRRLLSRFGFVVLLTGSFTVFSNGAPPQVRGEEPVAPPAFPGIGQKPIDEYTTKDLADIGEMIIFGEVGTLQGAGKGQCPLCHGFRPGTVSERAPNLYGVTRRAVERLKEPRYLHPDSVQIESFPGSGRARTADEYIAESHICPSCYVVEGYGYGSLVAKTTGRCCPDDRESPMAPDHIAPIGLNINEMIAVHTWLYVHNGETPPSPAQIRADHERFLPPGWQPYRHIATGADPPNQILDKRNRWGTFLTNLSCLLWSSGHAMCGSEKAP